MKNKLSILLIAASISLSGCSFETIPPATKGKILTTAGYQKGTLPPSKITLWGRDKLVLLETKTGTYKETVDIVLKDKLTLTADVRFRGRIKGDGNIVDAMFNDIPAGPDNIITFNEAYSVYGRMAVRNIVREIIGQYTVEDVQANYNRISNEVATALVKELKSTPIEVADVALGRIAYPDVVTKAIDAAKARDMAIAEAEAQARIDMTKKKNEQALALAQRDIEITKAKTIRDANKIMGESITPELLALKRIEALKLMSKNENAVFMPVESMTSTGAQVRMFQR